MATEQQLGSAEAATAYTSCEAFDVGAIVALATRAVEGAESCMPSRQVLNHKLQAVLMRRPERQDMCLRAQPLQPQRASG